jgi:hypothetical protein
MGSRAGCDHAGKIPGGDDRRGGPTNAHLGTLAKGIDTTWAHITYAAADPQFAKPALRLHLFRTIPNGIHFLCLNRIQQLF